MSWFKEKKELYTMDDEEYLDYDPNNPYTLQVEDEFIEIKIGKTNDNKLIDESELPSESKH
jgi:hypothetical protein